MSGLSFTSWGSILPVVGLTGLWRRPGLGDTAKKHRAWAIHDSSTTYLVAAAKNIQIHWVVISKNKKVFWAKGLQPTWWFERRPFTWASFAAFFYNKLRVWSTDAVTSRATAIWATHTPTHYYKKINIWLFFSSSFTLCHSNTLKCSNIRILFLGPALQS